LPLFERTVAFISLTVAMMKSSPDHAKDRGKPPGVPGGAVGRVYSDDSLK
jgi:hypothetical protein